MTTSLGAPSDSTGARLRDGLPWRRIVDLARPHRLGLAEMISLSLVGSLVGLVPPLGVGSLVDGLARRGATGASLAWASAIVAAVLAEALAYVASDGLYARTAGRLLRDLRVKMLEGSPGRAAAAVTRFVSDVEKLEELAVLALDQGAVGLFDLLAPLVALAVLDPVALGAFAAVLAVSTLAARRGQLPAGAAGLERQEALETMAAALARRGDACSAFERVLRADVRLGWLSAANRHGSRALVGLGPVVVVLAAGAHGGHRVGGLLSIYLLAGRAFGGAETLIDLGLDLEVVRGAIRRCFELVDGT